MRAARGGRLVLAGAALMAAAAACGSAHRGTAVASGGTAASTAPTVASVPATTATRPRSTATSVRQLPTVPNCGGGAYEPKTLLIVCGSGTTMATGVSWRSWESAHASGSGTVHLQLNGRAVSAPATLLLGEVVNGPVGPQFTRLTVTWTGSAPDGKAQETYRLQIQG